jgi:hypothetical protein
MRRGAPPWRTQLSPLRGRRGAGRAAPRRPPGPPASHPPQAGAHCTRPLRIRGSGGHRPRAPPARDPGPRAARAPRAGRRGRAARRAHARSEKGPLTGAAGALCGLVAAPSRAPAPRAGRASARRTSPRSRRPPYSSRPPPARNFSATHPPCRLLQGRMTCALAAASHTAQAPRGGASRARGVDPPTAPPAFRPQVRRAPRREARRASPRPPWARPCLHSRGDRATAVLGRPARAGARCVPRRRRRAPPASYCCVAPRALQAPTLPHARPRGPCVSRSPAARRAAPRRAGRRERATRRCHPCLHSPIPNQDPKTPRRRPARALASRRRWGGAAYWLGTRGRRPGRALAPRRCPRPTGPLAPPPRPAGIGRPPACRPRTLRRPARAAPRGR